MLRPVPYVGSLVASLLAVTTVQAQEPPPASPDRTDQALAGILAGALATSDATFWPGYRFASDPLMAYRPADSPEV